jgi:hypothetical protein
MMMMWTFAVPRGGEPYSAIAFAPSRRNKRNDPVVMRNPARDAEPSSPLANALNSLPLTALGRPGGQ